jgi:hypothetical protein
MADSMHVGVYEFFRPLVAKVANKYVIRSPAWLGLLSVGCCLAIV